MQCLIESLTNDDETLNYTTRAEIRKKYIFETRDKGRSRSYIFGYEKDNPSYEFLKTSIFNEASEIHSVPEATIYTANLLMAKNFFQEKVKELSALQVEEIYTKLTQHVQFNIFYIEPDLDVFVTFETMNNRGKPLSHLELLKNRLIYLSTKLDEDKIEQERLRRKINESWKTIYHYLGKKASRNLDDDVFLKIHFLSYFGPDLPKTEEDEQGNGDYDLRRFIRQDLYFKSHLLEQIFTVKRLYGDADGVKLSATELDAYSEDIKRAVEIYYHVNDPDQSPFTDSEKILLQQMSRARRLDARLLSLVTIQTTTEPERRISLFRTLERYAFLSQMTPYYFRELNLEQFAIKLKAADLSPEEISRRIESTSKRFVESADFLDSMRSIGKSDGFYGWSALRYFMYEYEQYLRINSKTSRQVLSWETLQAEGFDSDHRSIEHIYPQRPNDQYWRERFTSKYAPTERNTLRNSLGNLLPVSLPKNSSLSNKSFPEKKGSVSSQVGYAYGCLSEIQIAQQEDWNAASIAARGIHLLSFMEKRWGFSIGDDEKKLELLGLGFVLSREGINISQLKGRYSTSSRSIK